MQPQLQDLIGAVLPHLFDAGAVVALIALVWRMRAAKMERVRAYAQLEASVTETARRFEEHLEEVRPVRDRFNKEVESAAIVRTKVENIERDVTRLINKMDELIAILLERGDSRTGGKSPA